MLDAFIILLAIVLIVLGARGTYQQIWNSILPQSPITAGPTTSIGQVAATGAASGAITQAATSGAASGAMLPIAGNPIGVVPSQVN